MCVLSSDLWSHAVAIFEAGAIVDAPACANAEDDFVDGVGSEGAAADFADGVAGSAAGFGSGGGVAGFAGGFVADGIGFEVEVVAEGVTDGIDSEGFGAVTRCRKNKDSFSISGDVVSRVTFC
jgi:hypothetical protein